MKNNLKVKNKHCLCTYLKISIFVPYGEKLIIMYLFENILFYVQ